MSLQLCVEHVNVKLQCLESLVCALYGFPLCCLPLHDDSNLNPRVLEVLPLRAPHLQQKGNPHLRKSHDMPISYVGMEWVSHTSFPGEHCAGSTRKGTVKAGLLQAGGLLSARGRWWVYSHLS